MNFYKPYEHFLAVGLIISHILALIVFGYEKHNFGIIFFNPAIFFLIGVLIWIRGVVYIPSNKISYSVVSGAPARFLGISFTVIAIVFFFVHNSGLSLQFSPFTFLYVQIALNALLCIVVSVGKGEMLYRS